MNKRFSAPVISAATAILLLGACGDDDDSSTATSESSTTTTEAPDDGSTVVAEGFVELVATADHRERPDLSVWAVEEDGEVSGDFRMSGHWVIIECADTDTDGVVILGGPVATSDDLRMYELAGLIIKEGDPDKVLLMRNDSGADSCTELVERTDVSNIDDSYFTELEDGDDIKTG